MAFNWGIRFIATSPTAAGSGGTRAAPRLDATVRTSARTAVQDLSRALDKLEEALPRRLRYRESSPAIPGTPGTPGTPAVPGVIASTSSAASINLTHVGVTAARIDATAQVNTAATSFSTRGPSWLNTGVALGTTTTNVTMSGVYTGTYSGALTFQVQSRMTVGVEANTVKVTDSTGATVANVAMGALDPAGTTYTLANGLEFSFSAGTIRQKDSWQVSVNPSTPTSVDTTKALGGTRAQSAWLDDGVTVTNGNFTVNGESISVATTDTLTTVLDRITASAAGVTASYDAATDSVSLVQKTLGDAQTITLGADTSGFLAAVKLSGASVTPGTSVSDPTIPMSTYPEFAGVSAGTITVNGVGISIDPSTQSVIDVLDAIHASSAGVDAAWNDTTHTAHLANRSDASPLVIDEGTTGFFSAVHITEGTFANTPGTPAVPEVPATPDVPAVLGRAIARSVTVAKRVDDVVRAFNRLQDTGTDWAGLGAVSQLRGALKTKVSTALGSGLDSGFGLRFSTDESGRMTARFGSQGRTQLGRAIRTDLGGVRDTLLERRANLGGRSLIDALRADLRAVSDALL